MYLQLIHENTIRPEEIAGIDFFQSLQNICGVLGQNNLWSMLKGMYAIVDGKNIHNTTKQEGLGY